MSTMSTHDLIEMHEHGTDLGNFYPRDHIFSAFINEDDARAAEALLIEQGFADADCHYIAPDAAEIATQHGLDSAGLLSMTGASLKLVEEYNRLARRGYHFLLVRAQTDEAAEAALEALRYHDCRMARRYHRLAVETLV